MKNELENTIMNKIKDGKVKLKSKYIFWAEKLGIGTTFVFSVILSILFFNLILFYLKETDNLKYLSFGKFGIFAFLESFPYLLVVVFILLIILSGYLITKTESSYKKPFSQLVLLMIIFIVFFGAILTFTNLSKGIENHSRMNNDSMRILLPFAELRDKGVSGIIFEKYDDYLIIQTPQGLRRVNFNQNNNFEIGQFIIAIGERNGYDFSAQEIKIIKKEEVPIIEREIDFKFRSFDRNKNFNLPPDLLFFKEPERECVKNCFVLKLNPKDCFENCRE